MLVWTDWTKFGRSLVTDSRCGLSNFVSLSPTIYPNVSPYPLPSALNSAKSGAVAVLLWRLVVVIVVVLMELILTGDRLSPVDLIPSRLVTVCHQTVHRCSFND